MPIIKSFCCWRSLRRGCYACSLYNLIYSFAVIYFTASHVKREILYLYGAQLEPEKESFIETTTITPNPVFPLRLPTALKYVSKALAQFDRPGPHLWFPPGTVHVIKTITTRQETDAERENVGPTASTASPENVDSPEYDDSPENAAVSAVLNIALFTFGICSEPSNFVMVYGVFMDKRKLLLPWIISVGAETVADIIDMIYLVWIKESPIAPVSAFLFTLDFFMIIINLYGLACVISQYQEYCAGRGTAEAETQDREPVVRYTATLPVTMTTSSAMSGRRRSAPRPLPSRVEFEEVSEAGPSMPHASVVLPKPSRSHVKKHVQFPDEHSCIDEDIVLDPSREDSVAIDVKYQAQNDVISSLWADAELKVPIKDR